MRYMYDSTNVADDPAGAQMVAYYIDGIYATTEAKVRARFPSAVLVPISAIGSNAGIVGDVEPGCMTVAGAVIWVLMRRAAGVDPTLYVNEMNGWGPARQAFINGGIPEPHWWVADYDGIAAVPAGAVAKQYANPTLTGGHFDKSVVADYWPGVDRAFGAAGGQLTGEDMPILLHDPATQNIYIVFEQGNRTVKRHLALAEWQSYSAGGAAFKDVTDATMLASVLALPDAAAAPQTTDTEPKTLTGTITGTLS